MIEVPLSRGMVAFVDDHDADRVMAVGKWYANPSCRTFYARKNFQRNGRWISLRMHTFITGLALVDHINGNGLDNRRANLRPATEAQNSKNRRRRSDNTSGHKGVSWNRARGQWEASIFVNGRTQYLGLYRTPEEAALAYDSAAREAFGEFARLNFPNQYLEAAL